MAQADGDADGNEREFEDHGTSVRTVSDILCGIGGCQNRPTTRVTGYIHFSIDGEPYSQDSILLCTECWKQISRYLRTDA